MVLPLLSIRAGEGQIVFVLGSFFFLMLAGLTTIGIAADTLFVAQIGPEKLPYGILLGQALIIPVFWIYGRVRGALKPRWIAPVVITTLVIVLFALFAAQRQSALVAAAGLLILLPSLAGILTGENGRLSTSLLNSRSARRLYPIIGTLGGFGATFGAYMSAQFSANLGVGLLVPLGGGLLLATLIPAWLAGRGQRPSPGKRKAKPEALRRNRYALVIVLTAGVIAAIATILRYQIGAVAATHYDEAGLGVFYSRLAIAINILSIVITLFVTRFAVGKLGAANSLLLYPGTLLLVATAAFLAPSLALITFAVAAERLVRQNVHRTVSSLTIMPLHEVIRGRVAILINGTARPLGTILASVGVLILSGELGILPWKLSWQQFSIVTALLSLSLLFALWFVRGRYVLELLGALHARRLRLDTDDEVPLAMDGTLKTLLLGYLASDLPERSSLALELLRGHVDEDVVNTISERWPSWDPALCEQAINTLGDADDGPAHAFVQRLGPDEPDGVRAAALRLSAARIDDAALAETAAAAPVATRAQAIALLIDRQGVASTKGLVETLAASDEPSDRLTAALTIAKLNVPWLDYLIPTLAPVAPRELLDVAARRPNIEFAETLVQWLGHDNYERFARGAILALGDGAVTALERALADPKLAGPALATLSALGTSAAYTALERAMAADDDQLAYRALSVAANVSAQLGPKARETAASTVSTALASADALAELAANNAGVAGQVAAHECDYELERAFTALALRYPEMPFRQLYLAAESPDTRQRSLAAEAMDEYLSGTERTRLLALVELRQSKPADNAGCAADWRALANVVPQAAAVSAENIGQLLDSGLFPGWRLNDLQAMADLNDSRAEHALIIRDGSAVGLDRLLLHGETPSREPGDLSIPLASIYAHIARNPRCGGLWLRGLANRIPEPSSTSGEVTRSEMLSLATRTLAEDHDTADDVGIWQRVFFLRTMALTQSLPSERLYLLAEISRTVTAEAGETIVREGRLGHHFYMVCRGQLSVTGNDGNKTLLGPSDAFGALALMRGARRSQTVVAEESSDLLTIDRVDFLDLIDGHPALVRSFSRLLAARSLAGSES